MSTSDEKTNIDGKSIGTLIVFIFSIIFVIQPVYLPIKLPRFGRQTIPLNLTTAPILAIAILWASQCLGSTQIRDGIVGVEGVKPYNILILFFSLAYMAITLDVTGVLQSAAYWVSNKGGADGWKLYFYFYLLLTGLSAVVGNDPIILSGTAFLVYYTNVVDELKPLPWLITEFAAANTASMVLFVGNPTNVVICEGFQVQNAAFTAYTILPFLACSVACFFALAAQYHSKHLPRKITPTTLNVRSVLLDPVGAWVGGFLLGTCLVVIIILSFFKVDVWMISLPFAVAKFVWDLSWDHFRYVTGRPMLGRGQARPADQSTTTQLGEVEMDDSSRPISPMTTRRQGTLTSEGTTLGNSLVLSEKAKVPSPPPSHNSEKLDRPKSLVDRLKDWASRLKDHFPTFCTALPRLPFALVPFAFSQFILIEGLTRQGWIAVFSNWLVKASHKQIHPIIWLVGVLGVILCNISGTNIGATILLTKVVQGAELSPPALRAAAISLAVASNIGAVSFTYSASLAGLLWKTILSQKGIKTTQLEFAKWNTLPLLAMTSVGLGVVSAEMAVLYRGQSS